MSTNCASIGSNIIYVYTKNGQPYSTSIIYKLTDNLNAKIEVVPAFLTYEDTSKADNDLTSYKINQISVTIYAKKDTSFSVSDIGSIKFGSFDVIYDSNNTWILNPDIYSSIQLRSINILDGNTSSISAWTDIIITYGATTYVLNDSHLVMCGSSINPLDTSGKYLTKLTLMCKNYDLNNPKDGEEIKSVDIYYRNKDITGTTIIYNFSATTVTNPGLPLEYIDNILEDGRVDDVNNTIHIMYYSSKSLTTDSLYDEKDVHQKYTLTTGKVMCSNNVYTLSTDYDATTGVTTWEGKGGAVTLYPVYTGRDSYDIEYANLPESLPTVTKLGYTDSKTHLSSSNIWYHGNDEEVSGGTDVSTYNENPVMLYQKWDPVTYYYVLQLSGNGDYWADDNAPENNIVKIPKTYGQALESYKIGYTPKKLGKSLKYWEYALSGAKYTPTAGNTITITTDDIFKTDTTYYYLTPTYENITHQIVQYHPNVTNTGYTSTTKYITIDDAYNATGIRIGKPANNDGTITINSDNSFLFWAEGEPDSLTKFIVNGKTWKDLYGLYETTNLSTLEEISKDLPTTQNIYINSSSTLIDWDDPNSNLVYTSFWARTGRYVYTGSKWVKINNVYVYTDDGWQEVINTYRMNSAGLWETIL